MAGLIFSLGVCTYGFLAAVVLVLDQFDSRQVVFAPTVTLPTDTALALLGLCATVLITLVATLWASGPVSDLAQSRGRRRALTVVTTATGIGSVVVGTAGGLHRPDEGWNFVIAPGVFGLGLVLAYVTSDVVFFIRQDRPLEEALRLHDADDRRTRLRIARSNWLLLSRSARWAEGRHPIRDRLRQTVILLGLLAAVLAATLATLGGRRAVTGYFGWWFLDLVVAVLMGQLAAHYAAIKFVARRWEPFYWYCLYGLLYLPVSLLVQLQLLIRMDAELPGGGLDDGVGVVLVLACWLVPPLMCLFGLTVVPRRWRRLRPMTQIRWSVIAAIGHEIDL
ncbi:MAG TPA: hypothetical protein VGX49_02795, partial [Jatrophihabitans sp.]|nr:hypothetical protein [Jatrophihabitans sp.]